MNLFRQAWSAFQVSMLFYQLLPRIHKSVASRLKAKQILSIAIFSLLSALFSYCDFPILNCRFLKIGCMLISHKPIVLYIYTATVNLECAFSRDAQLTVVNIIGSNQHGSQFLYSKRYCYRTFLHRKHKTRITKYNLILLLW